MQNHIYALYYIEPGDTEAYRRYFYVGQSSNPDRRAAQHRNATAAGREDKYVFMRALMERGVRWEHEVVCAIPEEQWAFSTERWHVIRLFRLGHILRNMKHGNREAQRVLAEQRGNLAIRSAADVRADLRERKSRDGRRARQLRRQVIEKTLHRVGVPDVATDTLLPQVLRRRLIRDGFQFVQRRVRLSEIFVAARSTPRLNRLEAELFHPAPSRLRK